MTINDNNIVLITGANKGIGLETARRLAELGWTVWLGARDTGAGDEAVEQIRIEHPTADVRLVQLDVTSDDSVLAARDTVAAGSGVLDVLVNNAGVGSRFGQPVDTTPAEFLPVYGVNVLGPVRVTNTFLPLLAKSARPRLVMVSSGLGSLGAMNDPDNPEAATHDLVYGSSKAALNMITTQYAKSLPATIPGIRVTAVNPGFTATAMNGFSGTQSVTEGSDVIIEACTADTLAGGFIDRNGVLAW